MEFLKIITWTTFFIKGTVEVWNMLHHHFCYAPYWPEWLIAPLILILLWHMTNSHPGPGLYEGKLDIFIRYK